MQTEKPKPIRPVEWQWAGDAYHAVVSTPLAAGVLCGARTDWTPVVRAQNAPVAERCPTCRTLLHRARGGGR